MDLSKDLDEYLYYDRDEIMRLDAYDLGHEQGVKQGIEQNAKANAIKMLKDKVPIEKISMYTMLSTEIINKLKEEIESKEE